MICRVGVCVALLSAACQVEKAPVEDDFAGVGDVGKADHTTVGLAGDMAFGQIASVVHQPPPRYLAVRFTAGGGDTVDIRVRSISGGDPVTWLLDAQGAVLAMSDDASASSLDSRIQLAMPSGPSSIHYIVFRDYDDVAGAYRITLGGQQSIVSCARDSDCAMVEAGCCAVGDYAAVRADRADDYVASLTCDPDLVCPASPIIDNDESAVCDNFSHTCEVLLPDEIACGGHSQNAHACPAGWECWGPDLAVDGTGDCGRTCGGFASIACPSGSICTDNPYDGCDSSSGADCTGLCSE